MKPIHLLSKLWLVSILFSLVGLSSCDNDRNIDPGPISLKQYDAQDFDRVTIASLGQVTLHDGPEFKVEIETHLEVHERIDVRVVGSTLEIDYEDNLNSNRIDRFEIDITAPLYTGVKLTGVANIIGNDGIQTSELDVELRGVGNITLRNIDVDAVTVNLDGVGDIELDGTATSGDMTLKDVGNIRAFDLVQEECNATLRGVGDIRINVTDFLDATLEGVGDIIYMGDPTVVTDITGEGDVRKK